MITWPDERAGGVGGILPLEIEAIPKGLHHRAQGSSRLATLGSVISSFQDGAQQKASNLQPSRNDAPPVAVRLQPTETH